MKLVLFEIILLPNIYVSFDADKTITFSFIRYTYTIAQLVFVQMYAQNRATSVKKKREKTFKEIENEQITQKGTNDNDENEQSGKTSKECFNKFTIARANSVPTFRIINNSFGRAIIRNFTIKGIPLLPLHLLRGLLNYLY